VPRRGYGAASELERSPAFWNKLIKDSMLRKILSYESVRLAFVIGAIVLAPFEFYVASAVSSYVSSQSQLPGVWWLTFIPFGIFLLCTTGVFAAVVAYALEKRNERKNDL